MAGRLSAARGRHCCDGERGLQEADSLPAAARRRRRWRRGRTAEARRPGDAVLGGEGRAQGAFRAVVATARHLPKKLEVALERGGGEGGGRRRRRRGAARGVDRRADRRGGVRRRAGQGRQGRRPPPGGGCCPTRRRSRRPSPSTSSEADAELRDSAGALLKAFDALTDCADVVDSATAALRGARASRRRPPPPSPRRTRRSSARRRRSPRSRTSLAAASDTTATLLAKHGRARRELCGGGLGRRDGDGAPQKGAVEREGAGPGALARGGAERAPKHDMHSAHRGRESGASPFLRRCHSSVVAESER